MNVDYSQLKEELVTDLSLELKEEPTFNREILAVKIDSVIREIMMLRNYEAVGKTEEWIVKDLKKYYAIIRNVALYDFSQIGASFETSHGENSVSRSWVNRNSLFAGVKTIAVVF